MSRHLSHRRSYAALALLVALCLILPGTVRAAPVLTQVSSDPYTNTDSQHRTQVEPDSFTYGSTVVFAFQSGRFFNGGSSNVGWATSRDGGQTWSNGFLPGTTVNAAPAGPWARVSDPAVAFDAAHGAWLISTLPVLSSAAGGGVLVSRSTDGGTTWVNPVTVASQTGADKDWIVCDNTATSPYYGHCYVEWDFNAAGNLIQMSTSTDGGQTWSTPRTTANRASGIGGQPLVQPNGTVVVPIDDASEGHVLAFRSTNGGASWSSTVSVATISSHAEAGGLRSEPLPSAEIDGAGRIFVVWQDCRFEPGCAANDIVGSVSDDGVSWSRVLRVPTDAVGSGVDHFIPGLAVDKATAGTTAHLALTYYYYPHTNCTTATCQLAVGFVSSQDGGRTWSSPIQLAGPMSLSWLAATDQGSMVGDYISTSISGGRAYPVFAVAHARAGTTFDEAMYTVSGGLTLAVPAAGSATEGPVLSTPPSLPAAPGLPTAH